MQFITCRGCRLPFERTVQTCPNCGELLPGLSRVLRENVPFAIFVAWFLSACCGCFWGAEVIARPPGPPLLLQLVTYVGAIVTIVGLGQLLATSIECKDEADRRYWRWACGIEGVVIGILIGGLMNPVGGQPKEVLATSWGLFAALSAGIPATCWWLRLKRQAKSCWSETGQLAVKRCSAMIEKLVDIEQTRHQAADALPPPLLAERLAILDRGRSDICTLRARYQACVWQTQLLQWHARLKLYLEGPAPVNRAGCEAAIAALDKHGARGLEMLGEWRASSDAAYPEPKACIERLEQLLDLCGRLRQSVLDHQIILVTRDPRAGAPEDTTFDQLRADLRTLEASIIRSEIQDPWNTAARIESETAQLVARAEIECVSAKINSVEGREPQLLNRVGGGTSA